MWKETKSSINHNENLKALVELLLEHGNSAEISQWTKELSALSAGGCWHLRFDGSCAHPQYGQCDGAGCADIRVEGGRSYVWEEEGWGLEDDGEPYL